MSRRARPARVPAPGRAEQRPGWSGMRPWRASLHGWVAPAANHRNCCRYATRYRLAYRVRGAPANLWPTPANISTDRLKQPQNHSELRKHKKTVAEPPIPPTGLSPARGRAGLHRQAPGELVGCAGSGRDLRWWRLSEWIGRRRLLESPLAATSFADLKGVPGVRAVIGSGSPPRGTGAGAAPVDMPCARGAPCQG